MTQRTLAQPLAVYYNPAQSVQTESFSPSANKPALVARDWQARFDADAVTFISDFKPMAWTQLCVAHRGAYVEGVFDGSVLNGFGNTDRAVADACLWTTGSLLAAAEHALHSRDGIACSLSSGFHHAGPDFGGGYCTFNGLAVVALTLAAKGINVGILDCDRHYGNGTVAIVREKRARGSDAMRYHYTVGGPDGGLSDDSPDAFMSSLDAALHALGGRHKPDLLLYQAGADMHEADPLGGFLPTTLMRERDRRVFRTTGQLGIPVAWNLAGGYQRGGASGIDPVLALHRSTLDEALHCDYGPATRELLRNPPRV